MRKNKKEEVKMINKVLKTLKYSIIGLAFSGWVWSIVDGCGWLFTPFFLLIICLVLFEN